MKKEILPTYRYKENSSIGLAFGCAVGKLSKNAALHKTMSTGTCPIPTPMNITTSKPDGYTTLDDANKYIRALFNVHKRYHYNRNERPDIKNYVLPDNSKYAIICTNGDYVFADTERYYATGLVNANEIVEVWTLTSILESFSKEPMSCIDLYMHAIYSNKIADFNKLDQHKKSPKDYSKMSVKELSKEFGISPKFTEIQQPFPTDIGKDTIDIANFYPTFMHI